MLILQSNGPALLCFNDGNNLVTQIIYEFITLPYLQICSECPLSQGANEYVCLCCVVVVTARYVFLKAIKKKQHRSEKEK